MKVPFKTVATVSGSAVMALAGLLVVAPKFAATYVLGKIPNTDVFRFMARRNAVLLGGWAALILAIRNAPPTKLRHTIAKSAAGTAGTVATVGIYEAVWGMANPYIWALVGFEALITAGFLGSVKDKPESYAAAAALPVDT